MADLYSYEFVQAPLAVVSGSFTLTGTTLSATAPVGSRTEGTRSVFSSLGGYLKVGKVATFDPDVFDPAVFDAALRFELSVDGVTWGHEQYVDAGTSTVLIGVTPQAGDGTLTTRLEVPV